MRFARTLPRSILGLTLAGLLLVGLPGVAVTVNAIFRADRIATLSTESTYKANEATRLAGTLNDRVTGMQRAAAQYRVIGDERLERAYLRQREAFLAAAEALKAQGPGEPILMATVGLLEAEQALFDHRSEHTTESAAQAWQELSRGATEILDLSRKEIEDASRRSAQATVDLQRRMTWQVAATLPLTLLLAAFSTLLITRPLQSVGDAIHRLAHEDFDAPVAVRGPLDVRQLGDSLDQLRLRIQSLEKQKLSFVRRISHELKTPLTTIRQGAELLADRRGTSSQETMEIADLLRESSLELQKLIEDLLEYGRTQRLSAQSLSIECVDLHDVVEGVLADLRFRSTAVAVDTKLSHVELMCDGSQLKTAIKNLVDNALKFTPARGRIEISLFEKNGEAVFEICDTGPGIPKADYERVFEPFYQGPVKAPGPVKGTGLGLAIAKDHIVAHGGRIEILDSEAGAHFRVSIPLARTV